MKTATHKRDCITDVPIVGKKYTLYPATKGHRSWLAKRGNKGILRGEIDEASAVEICFAYTTDPEVLQTFTGEKATKAVRKFCDSLPETEFVRIMEHVTSEWLKVQKAMGAPKKKPEPLPQLRKTRTRVARR